MLKCVAYVDGSFSMGHDCEGNEVGIYGSGYYIIIEGVADPFMKAFGDADPTMATMRNVAGEIMAALAVVQNFEGVEDVDLSLYYDYEGIEKWVTGEWKAKKPETQAYRDVMRKAMESVKINFIHVYGHTGVRGNEIVDQLAKQGVQMKAMEMGVTL